MLPQNIHNEFLLCILFSGTGNANVITMWIFSYKSSDAIGGGLGELQPTQPGGQIMPTALLLAHPNLKTLQHLCSKGILSKMSTGRRQVDKSGHNLFNIVKE